VWRSFSKESKRVRLAYRTVSGTKYKKG
jgi:hypothetical protein